MRFEEFWDSLKKGGETPEGDKFKITDDERLHIRSLGNRNLKYYITKDTVRRYFEEDIPIMGERVFRRNRSSYFYNIYKHIVK